MRRAPTPAERQEAHSLTQGRCLYCRDDVALEDMEVDHLYPVSKGGSSDIRNLVPACRTCNRKKHARIVMDYAPLPNTRLKPVKIPVRVVEKVRTPEEAAEHKVQSDLQLLAELCLEAFENHMQKKRVTA